MVSVSDWMRVVYPPDLALQSLASAINMSITQQPCWDECPWCGLEMDPMLTTRGIRITKLGGCLLCWNR